METNATSSTERFLAAATQAAAKRNPGDGRALLAIARAFATWSAGRDVQSLHPTAHEVAAFATFGRRRLTKVRWAMRAVLAEADVLVDEHGLGTGCSTATSGRAPAEEQAAVAAFLTTIESRRPVWASGIRKLQRWCAEVEIDLLEVAPADLDDYRSWLRRVGGSEGELLVIARRFLKFRFRAGLRL